MNEELKQNHNPAIKFSHIGVIAVCAIVLVFFTFLKSGFNLNLAKNNNSNVKTYTIEQAQADAARQLSMQKGQADNGEENLNPDEQIAMIDPTSNVGQVLGASTDPENAIFPNAEEVWTADVLSQIHISLVNDDSAEAIKEYKFQFAAVESASNSEQILQDLSSTDNSVLAGVHDKVQTLVQNLMAVQVPKPLEEYHKFKLIYYMQLSQLADGYIEKNNAADPKDTGIQIFSIVDKLQRISAEIQNKYQIQL
jgi:hypothetical protein